MKGVQLLSVDHNCHRVVTRSSRTRNLRIRTTRSRSKGSPMYGDRENENVRRRQDLPRARTDDSGFGWQGFIRESCRYDAREKAQGLGHWHLHWRFFLFNGLLPPALGSQMMLAGLRASARCGFMICITTAVLLGTGSDAMNGYLRL